MLKTKKAAKKPKGIADIFGEAYGCRITQQQIADFEKRLAELEEKVRGLIVGRIAMPKNAPPIAPIGDNGGRPEPEKPVDKYIKSLQEMIDIQCSNGNWNYNPYMHGMANGMIFAMSILTGKEPAYKSAPDEWLSDKVQKPSPLDAKLGDLANALAELNSINMKVRTNYRIDWYSCICHASGHFFVIKNGETLDGSWNYSDKQTLADFIRAQVAKHRGKNDGRR